MAARTNVSLERVTPDVSNLEVSKKNVTDQFMLHTADIVIDLLLVIIMSNLK